MNQRNIYFSKISKCGEFFSNHKSYNKHRKNCTQTLANTKSILNYAPEKVEDDQQMEVTQFQEKMIEIIFGTNMSFSQVEKPYFIELFTFFGVKETDILTQFLLLK
ncbi:hypothetical protein M9Y10_012786 [Tritrichomonas musculus]|uniref:C2H2-type domain-containing protein n=1 Tax=Tritrichomonas musculus TaxID=1915356 RepID=A0ABR2IDL2_9EUKA